MANDKKQTLTAIITLCACALRDDTLDDELLETLKEGVDKLFPKTTSADVVLK